MTTDAAQTVTQAAFECQRCATLTRIPQTTDDFVEPPQCQCCEQSGPFRLHRRQSEFVDAQTLQLRDDPASLPEGTAPDEIEVSLEDDLTGTVVAGERVRVTGVLRLDQDETSGREQPTCTPVLKGVNGESLGEEPTGDGHGFHLLRHAGQYGTQYAPRKRPWVGGSTRWCEHRPAS
ncbi:hypothetical protein VB773_00130 [Haloarculaceae archaeon H-GB2-1]|nr:hypothetical protein [Haloarculaceae archaeon H-GB1-1]MEA5406139.1 hypothetical protein [Haloarculaceae archaeon H-GB2-1]